MSTLRALEADHEWDNHNLEHGCNLGCPERGRLWGIARNARVAALAKRDVFDILHCAEVRAMREALEADHEWDNHRLGQANNHDCPDTCFERSRLWGIARAKRVAARAAFDKLIMEAKDA